MNESTKCHSFRKKRGDFATYLRGSGIDIGAGRDPLRVAEGTVRAWDMADGDAQLLVGVPDNHYDFVYSSHCLEHMRHVPEALANWIRVLKPGGYLYIVVPDYILYEKLVWPSRFNSDHKQSFSFLVQRASVVRDNHFHIDQDLLPLLSQLGIDHVRTPEDLLKKYGGDYEKAIAASKRTNSTVNRAIEERRSSGEQ